jgi:hypothetical protein
MPITLHRDNGRVLLDGVTGWFIGDKESSVHAAQEAVMRALGEDVAYDDLVGVSGLAFRMQVSKEGLCPSSPHSCCGWRCTDRSSQALPWNVRGIPIRKDDANQAAEARRAVVDSIDRGIPVQYGCEEDGVVVGYQKGGQEWICLHPMKKEGKETVIETSLPWGIALFTSRKDAVPSGRELAAGALHQAVDMAHAEETKENGAYFLGFRAWDAWIGKIEALDDADEKTRSAALLGNAWIYECLAHYRGSAARYLRGIAGEFDDATAGRLRKAADLYEKMATQVLTDATHCVLDVAPYAWRLKGNPWTAGMRRDQIRRLKAALPMEHEAIAEIEEAAQRST